MNVFTCLEIDTDVVLEIADNIVLAIDCINAIQAVIYGPNDWSTVISADRLLDENTIIYGPEDA